MQEGTEKRPAAPPDARPIPALVEDDEPQPEFKHYAAGYALIFLGMIGLALLLVAVMKILR